MVTGQSGDERPHEVKLCGGVVVEKAFAQQGRQLGGNSIRLKHRTRIYPKNQPEFQIEMDPCINCLSCKRIVPLFENSRPSAATQLRQPIHSQSANFGNFKLNLLNVVQTLFLRPVLAASQSSQKIVKNLTKKSSSDFCAIELPP